MSKYRNYYRGFRRGVTTGYKSLDRNLIHYLIHLKHSSFFKDITWRRGEYYKASRR
jgi:hypothetical protein